MHGRAPNGQILPGYTPNPGGSTTHIERAQQMLEDAVEIKTAKGHVLNKIWGQILDRGLGKATQRIKQEAEDVAIIVDIGGE